jgi:hypothetical protein
MSEMRKSLRRLIVLAAAVGWVAGSHANAQMAEAESHADAATPAVDRSPFLGQWELDLTRMPDTYGPPPKRVTFRFDDVGSGKWLMTVEITAPDDSIRRMAVEYRRDGRAVKGQGDTAEGDSVAVNSPAPNVLVLSMAKDKMLNGVRTYAVSPDGREMTESAANVDVSGAPFVRNFHFRRIRQDP